VITFFGFLIALAFTYFRMLRYRLPFGKGAAGYIFPLLPYLPLSAIGYQKFFCSEANSDKLACNGRSFERNTSISPSVSDEGCLVEQQLLYKHHESHKLITEY